MATGIPWGTPTVSDAAKLGLLNSFVPGLSIHNPDYGKAQYELLPQLVNSDAFPNLDKWNLTETGAGFVTVAGGIVSLNGNGTLNNNGMVLKIAETISDGVVFELFIRHSWSAAPEIAFSVMNNAGLSNTAGEKLIYNYFSTSVAWENRIGGAALMSRLDPADAGLAAGDWFQIRVAIRNIRAGALRDIATWVRKEGDTRWVRCGALLAAANIALASAYPQVQRRHDSATVQQVKLYKYYRGFAADGPTLTYVADAGAGKVIDNFNLTNLAPVGGWATTNVTFAWSFDDGVPAYSAELTLAQLNAAGNQAGRHRYARLRITVNSDGATQQYAGEINATNATLGIGDFPETNNTYLQDTVQLAAGTLTDPTEQMEVLTTNIAADPLTSFALGDTVYVNGTLEFVKALAAANVRVRIYTDAGVLVATLFDAAYNFLASTAASLIAINGGAMMQHTPAVADGYYAEVVVTHADLPNGSIRTFSGFAVAAPGGGGGGPGSIRVIDPVMLMVT